MSMPAIINIPAIAKNNMLVKPAAFLAVCTAAFWVAASFVFEIWLLPFCTALARHWEKGREPASRAGSRRVELEFSLHTIGREESRIRGQYNVVNRELWPRSGRRRNGWG